MAPVSTLTIADGVRVVVPDSLDLMTPYILREQEDWFEDEIKFLRRHLQPGDRAVDIGANYGVYTLSMARAVGPRGAVFAFEPASATADMLRQAVVANGFDNVVLEVSALSNAVGSARLVTGEGTELNTLEQNAPGAAAGETVRVVTLDEAMARHAWTNIDLLKMDAEGEERRIIEGGRGFFSKCSPLVLYEIKAQESLHLDLVEEFAALGYESYRLVPGLDVLAPFDAGRPADRFLLNLFCCKQDRAASLARRGLLVVHPRRQSPSVASSEPAVPSRTRLPVAFPYTAKLARLWRSSPPAPSEAWKRLTRLPYAAKLAPLWRSSARAADRSELDQALADYLSSQDRASSAEQRLNALERAFHRLVALCGQSSTHLRHASLARVAAEFGERKIALDALNVLYRACAPDRQPPDVSEPFLAVTSRFDAIAPDKDIHRWLLASVLQALETLSSYSSFFVGKGALRGLELIEKLGYTSEEMRRRLQLVRSRFSA
jgi:FkbM family methyltransferase